MFEGFQQQTFHSVSDCTGNLFNKQCCMTTDKAMHCSKNDKTLATGRGAQSLFGSPGLWQYVAAAGECWLRPQWRCPKCWRSSSLSRVSRWAPAALANISRVKRCTNYMSSGLLFKHVCVPEYIQDVSWHSPPHTHTHWLKDFFKNGNADFGAYFISLHLFHLLILLVFCP